MEARIVKELGRLVYPETLEDLRKKGFIPFTRELSKEEKERELRLRLFDFAQRVYMAGTDDLLGVELLEIQGAVNELRELRGWPEQPFGQMAQVAVRRVYIDCMEGPDHGRQ